MFRHLLLLSLLFSTPVLAKVNINRASADELQEIPKIGPKLADKIVKNRSEEGRFSSVEELARVPGISSGLLAKIIDHITTGSSRGSALVIREGEVVTHKMVQKVLARFGAEPTIREVQNAAVRFARADPNAIDGWRIRARIAGMAPELKGRFAHKREDDTAQTSVLNAGSDSREVTEDDREYKGYIEAKWKLDRLIFEPQELKIATENVRMANMRERILDEVTRRYFERRRLQVDLELSPPTDLNDRIRKELRTQELTADIDSLTGGWFSRKLIEANRDPY